MEGQQGSTSTGRRGRDETPEERADRNFNDILQELRVALTGTQLISGFLLAVAFTDAFRDLEPHEVAHYLTLVVASAAATLLGLTPVMVHRLHFAKHVKGRIVRVSDRLLLATIAVVSLLVVGVTSFIFSVVVSLEAGAWAGGASGAAVAGLWALAVAARSRTVAGRPEQPEPEYHGTLSRRPVTDVLRGSAGSGAPPESADRTSRSP